MHAYNHPASPPPATPPPPPKRRPPRDAHTATHTHTQRRTHTHTHTHREGAGGKPPPGGKQKMQRPLSETWRSGDCLLTRHHYDDDVSMIILPVPRIWRQHLLHFFRFACFTVFYEIWFVTLIWRDMTTGYSRWARVMRERGAPNRIAIVDV